ncbi:NAD(P)-dependent dehydrogenase (short-subunit alcohol dehydrogenase family) [Microbacterium ginsengiterrae]|uniref:NAD(P)-dependent dehydrogenase (Short-subunit alcohol dehydrogenase family) n=1 Tax=Microbacterium ginsengiterrae TaxID=546115 RepID=A0A7W9CBI7_9MICO|nr:SDR family NAD(P)-dependent oxidoreductase [Microbacterium ginsengiterrae]MBB5742567.1 NAD(P)-dependent dehydrogenase (short-subunit alcohol dehydrogenase family) [Microbacterium ginsengiterrae]
MAGSLPVYPDLRGRVVVLSGGSTGIGRAAAEQFLAQGCRVVNIDVAEADGAEFPTIRCDVRDEHAVMDALDQVIAEHGGLDVVFANAGITWAKTVSETSTAELEGVLAVNLVGVYNLVRHGYLRMRARDIRGSIVLTASPHAWRTTADLSAYAISKAGVLALSNALAIEGGPHGIRVNAVSPGAVDTPILRREAQTTGDEEGALRRWGAVRPAGRVGLPGEIAAAALFLASDAASFVTGSNMVVDGGMSAYLGGAMSVTEEEAS